MSFGINLVRFFSWAQQVRQPLRKKTKGRALLVPMTDALEARRLMTLNVWIQNDNSLVVTADNNTSQYLTLDYDNASTTYTITSFVTTENFAILTNNPTGLTVTKTDYNPGTGDPATLTIVETPGNNLNSITLATGSGGDRFEDNIVTQTGLVSTVYINSGGGTDLITKNAGLNLSFLVVDGGAGDDVINFGLNAGTATGVEQNFSSSPFDPASLSLDTYVNDGTNYFGQIVRAANIELLNNQLTTPLADYTATVNGAFGTPSGSFSQSTLRSFTNSLTVNSAQATVFGTQTADQMILAPTVDNTGVQVQATSLPTTSYYGLTPASGVLRLMGLGGNDLLKAATGVEGLIAVSLSGGDGDDLLSGDATLSGGDGNDTFIVPSGTNTIDGGAGFDTIQVDGSAAADTIDVATTASTVNITVNTVASTNTVTNIDQLLINGLAGNDTITLAGTGTIAAVINGGDGNDNANATGYNAVVTISGGSGDDTLTGGSAADYIDGGDGFDYMDGGLGNDLVEGGGGGDIFTWDEGDGLDSIDGGSGDNLLQFNGSTSATNSFTVGVNSGFPNGFFVNLNNSFTGMVTANIQGLTLQGGSVADNVLMQDLTGTSLSTFTLDLGGSSLSGSLITFNGTTGNDVLGVGGSGSTVYVTGLPYAASVKGYVLNPIPTSIDTIQVNGGAGYDTMFVNASLVQSVAVKLDGGIGNDRLYTEAPNYFNQPATLYRINLTGGTGVNEYTPSAGRVVVVGSSADIMHFDGNDTSNTMGVSQSGSVVTYTLGFTTTLVDVTNFTGLLSVDAKGGDDSVTLAGYTLPSVVYGGSGNDSIDASGLAVSVNIYGNDGNDTLSGSTGNDTISGGAGEDQINAGLGDDYVDGDSGLDTITAGAGEDTLNGGADSDWFIVQINGQLIYMDGGTGSDLLWLQGTAGDDALTMNSLFDSVVIQSGALDLNLTDTESYYIDLGDQNDSLAVGDMTQVQIEMVQFVAGAGVNNVSIAGVVGDNNVQVGTNPVGAVIASGLGYLLEVSGSNTADTLTVDGGQGDDTIKAIAGVEGLIQIVLSGGEGNDYLSADATLLGGAGNDTLVGGAGNDSLDGGAGDDLFVPTAGLDTLVGGTGFDTVLLAGSVGMDNTFGIFQNTAVPVVLNVNAASFSAVFTDINQISVQGSTGSDSLTIAGDLASPVAVLGMMGEGSDWVSAWSASAGQITTIYGQSGDDTMLSGAGTDNFFGGDDFDSFVAGPLSINSTDLFDGGSGYNALTVESSGAGSAVVTAIPSGYQVTNTAGTGVTTALNIGNLDVNLLPGGGIVINGSNNDDNIRTFDIDSDLTPTLPAGVVLVTGLPGDVTLTGVGAGTVIEIHGQGGNDTFQDLGDAGATLTFHGDSGNDTFIVNQESEPATFSGDAGTDTVAVTGTVGADFLSFSAGATLEEIYYNSIGLAGLVEDAEVLNVNALAGNDTIAIFGINPATGLSVFNLNGQEGDDLIGLTLVAGGTFNLSGGSGNDTFIGADGTATVLVHGDEGNDLVQLGSAGGSAYGDSGDDSLTGGSANDFLSGGEGNDTISGAQGADSISGDAGDDVITWNIGDGNDTVSGGTGTNELTVNGDTVTGNAFTLQPQVANSSLFEVLIAGNVISAGDIAHVSLSGGSASDTFNIADLTGTGVTLIDTNFGQDTVADTVSVMGTAQDDHIILAGIGSAVEVTGLPWLVRATNMAYSASTMVDGILIDAGRGYDWLAAGVTLNLPVLVTLQGGPGADLFEVNTPAMGDNPNGVTVVTGSDMFVDTIKLNNGRNRVLGGPNVVVLINGTENNDSISVSGLSSPGRVDIAVNSMFSSNDLTGFTGVIQANALGGNDRVTFNAVSIPTTLSGGDGNDSIDASSPTWATDPALVNVTMYGGSGDDVLTAGYGTDVLDGGDGSDVLVQSTAVFSTLQGGAGDDLFILYPVVPGALTPRISGGTGTDSVVVNGSGTNPNVYVLGPNTAADPLQTSLQLTSGGTTILATAFEVEGYVLNGGSQADTFQVQDLTGLGINNVQIGLSDVGGDAAADNVTVAGTSSSDRIYLVGSQNPSSPAGVAEVQGLPWGVQVLNSALVAGAMVDGINVHSGIGEDTIIAGYSLTAPVLVTLQGGTGYDDLRTAAPALGSNAVRVTINAQDSFDDDIYLFNGNNAVLGTAGDVIHVNGTNAADTIGLTGSSGGSVLTINVDGMVSTNDISAYLGTIFVDALGGNDSVSLGGYGLATTVSGGLGNDTINASSMASAVTLDGGSGDDVLTGGSVADYLDGGAGFDAITGNGGNDSLEGGDGGDIFYWASGDGYDAVDGGSGDNQLYFTGNASLTNSFSVAASTSFPIGFVVNLNDAFTGVDTANIQGLVVIGGLLADNILMQDMSGTSLRTLNINLNGGSQFGSYVTFNGTTGNDVLGVGGNGSTIYVTGLPYTASVVGYTVNPDTASIDTIRVNGGAGYDTLFANASQVQSVAVVLDGGIGNDKLYSEAPLYFNQPSSFYRVTLIGGTGLNEYTPTAGNVIVSGTGADIMHLDGNDLGNTLGVTQSGSMLSYALDATTTLIDVSSYTGLLNVNAGGGNDTVTLGGYAFASSVFGGLGDDTINANGLSVPVSLYGGQNDDDLTGGSAADYLDGGEGYDFLTGGQGDDLVEGGSGGDAIFYSAGDGNDEVDGGEGFNTFFLSGYASLANTIIVNPSLVYPTDIQVSGTGIQIDASAVQGVTLTGGTDADTFNIADLTGTCVQNLVVNVGQDTAADTVNWTGTATADDINVHGGPNNSVQVGGLAVLATVINTALGANGELVDTVSAEGSFGLDRLVASPSLGAIPVGVALHGGGGYDLLIANAPALGTGPRVTLTGGSLDDTFWLQSGNNVIIGSAGDLIEVNGTANADTITANGNATTLNLSVNGVGSTNDVSNFQGVMQVNAVGGNDSVTLGGYIIPTSVFGGDGDDSINASALTVPVSLYGGQNDDDLTGGSAADYLDGGEGYDFLTGGQGDDLVEGGSGGDSIFYSAGDGNDEVDGGEGFNSLFVSGYASSANTINVNPYAAYPTDILTTGNGIWIDASAVQGVTLTGGTDADTFNIADLTGTCVQNLIVDFGLDSAADTVSYSGSAKADEINVHSNGGGSNNVILGGLAALATVVNATLGSGGTLVDTVNVDGSFGDDKLVASYSLGSIPVNVGLYGAGGYNLLIGAAPALGSSPRVILDGTLGFSDTFWLQAGSNLVVGSPEDKIVVNGSSNADIISATGNATTLILNVDGQTSTNDITLFQGVMQIEALGGNDTVTLAGYVIPTSVSGGDGSDTINASAMTVPVSLYGGSGDDTVHGGSGNDYIEGNDGSDDIYGNAGNDRIYGGADIDTFYWAYGDGNDSIDGGTGQNNINIAGDTTNGSIFSLTPMSTLQGVAQVDISSTLGLLQASILTASIQQVSLIGGTGQDTFNISDLTGTAVTIVNTDFGQDTVADNLTVTGTANDDNLYVTGASDAQVVGLPWKVTASHSAMNGTQLVDGIAVDAGLGWDYMSATGDLLAPMLVSLIGGRGADTLLTTAPAMGSNPYRVTIDVTGGVFVDTIYLWNGRNRVVGTADDIIIAQGSANNDTVSINQAVEGTVFNVNGNISTNDLTDFAGVILVDLQAGNDTATLSGYTVPTNVSGGDGNDLVNAALLGSNVTITGGSGNDTLYGSALGDQISGDAGNDDIYGNAGTDSLFGGEGNDDFYWKAGDGFDLIDGGSGDDYALFTGAAGVENGFTLTPLTTPVPSTANGIGAGDANRVLVTHAGGQVSHFGDIEAVSIYGNGTCDTFGIGNLQTTGLRVVDVAFSPTTIGGVVATYATNLPDSITVTADAPDQIGINGLAVPVRVFNATPATAIVVHGGFGADNFEVDPQAEAQAIIVIDGGAGNDSITGGSVIIGGPGNNLLIGDDLPNTIVGGTGSDTILGLGGNDLLFGDALVTNVDDDGPNCQYLANLVITPTLTGAPDLISGGDGDDRINGNIGDDTIQGGSGNNEIGELTYQGIFFPEPGNDLINAADGDNEVHSGPGNDQVTLGNGNNCVFGGDGTNNVTVGNGTNRIVTGTGNDTVTAGNGNNTIFSGAGDDTVNTGSGNDVVVLGSGNDTAKLGEGNDLAWGEDGNDFIIGGMGNDTIYGGSGNDILWGGTHATAPVKNSSQVVTKPNDGNDVLAGEGGFDQLDGGTGNNIMDAGADNIRETMIGSGGWDTAYIHRNEGIKQDVLKNHSKRYTLIPYGSMPVATVPATPTDCTSPITIVIPDPLSGKLAKAPVKAALPKPTTKVVGSASIRKPGK